MEDWKSIYCAPAFETKMHDNCLTSSIQAIPPVLEIGEPNLQSDTLDTWNAAINGLSFNSIRVKQYLIKKMVNGFKRQSNQSVSLPAFILVLMLIGLSPASTGTEAAEKVVFERIQASFKGDLDQIRQRRLIRVLVSYSKSNFFYDYSAARGFEHELLQAYEKHLNKQIKGRYEKIRMVFIPVPFSHLLNDLRAGKGDVAAAGLTITPQREKSVNFTIPYIPRVDEVVVVNKAFKTLRSIEDLSGQILYVRAKSSYVTHLKSLNRQLKVKRKAPIMIKEADQYIGTEDILEFVNAGIFPITVADHHIAELWAQFLPDIIVRKDLKINSGGSIAWAVRKECPHLLSSLNSFLKKHKRGSLLGNILFKRYYQNSKWIKNPNAEQEQKKLLDVLALFKKYADRYDFNYLAIAALAYQESHLDNSKKNPSGAVGIMQVLPSTASDPHVNIKNIHRLENNIHAGVKYLNFLRQRYFSNEDISAADRVNFSWAAYNAGPRKINQLRKIAAKRGFDPNQWFYNVEKIAAEVIGRETVEYVANINKYFVAYQLQFDFYQKRQKKLNSIKAKQ